MGWKAIRDHYKIEHIVQVTDAGICIGSPYNYDLIVMGLDGVLKKRDDGRVNEKLRRYMADFDRDPEKLRELAIAHDEFTTDVTVWTYDGGQIIEKQCETPGWPNVTHDGQMMYDNTFSTDPQQVIKWAKENAAAWVKLETRNLQRRQDELGEAEQGLRDAQQAVADLDALEPITDQPPPTSEGPK